MSHPPIPIPDPRAYLDYLVARDFPVPRSTQFVDHTSGETKEYAIIHHDDAALLGMENLFWPALEVLAREQKEPSRLVVPAAPVIKITALVSERDGVWRPHDLDAEA